MDIYGTAGLFIPFILSAYTLANANTDPRYSHNHLMPPIIYTHLPDLLYPVSHVFKLVCHIFLVQGLHRLSNDRLKKWAHLREAEREEKAGFDHPASLWTIAAWPSRRLGCSLRAQMSQCLCKPPLTCCSQCTTQSAEAARTVNNESVST